MIATAGSVIGVAGFSGGVAAQNCDIVVDNSGSGDYTTIQAAIDNATTGATVCVRSGTYTETVSVDKGVTLIGETDPDGPNPSVVDGSVEVSADGVTIRRLKVAPTATVVPGGLDPHGILVSGELSGVTVEGNVVEGMMADATAGATAQSVTINGIQVWNDGPGALAGTTIRNNTVRDMHNMGDAGAGWPNYGGAAAIKIQGVAEGTEVVGNTIDSIHSAGWTYGIVTTHTNNAPDISPEDTTVEQNTIEMVNNGTIYDVFDDPNSAPYPGPAFAIDGDSVANEAVVTLNNFLQTPIGAQNKDDSHTLDARCNYWGHASGPSTDVTENAKAATTLGDVDHMPWNTRKIGRGNNPENSCVGGKNADKGEKKGH